MLNIVKRDKKKRNVIDDSDRKISIIKNFQHCERRKRFRKHLVFLIKLHLTRMVLENSHTFSDSPKSHYNLFSSF